MSEPGANEIFQSAVNNAALFKAVVCLIGFACVFMGYRLFVRRVDVRPSTPDTDERTPGAWSAKRGGAATFLALFGMSVIALALFRSTPVVVHDTTEVQAEGASDSSPMIAPAGRDRATAVAPEAREKDGTKVRVRMVTPSVRFSSNEEVKPTTSAGDLPSHRPSGQVRTKGAYTPFPKPKPVETNTLRPLSQLTISNGAGSATSVALSNRMARAGIDTNRPLRAPFKIRVADP